MPPYFLIATCQPVWPRPRRQSGVWCAIPRTYYNAMPVSEAIELNIEVFNLCLTSLYLEILCDRQNFYFILSWKHFVSQNMVTIIPPWCAGEALSWKKNVITSIPSIDLCDWIMSSHYTTILHYEVIRHFGLQKVIQLQTARDSFLTYRRAKKNYVQEVSISV